MGFILRSHSKAYSFASWKTFCALWRNLTASLVHLHQNITMEKSNNAVCYPKASFIAREMTCLIQAYFGNNEATVTL